MVVFITEGDGPCFEMICMQYGSTVYIADEGGHFEAIHIPRAQPLATTGTNRSAFSFQYGSAIGFLKF